MTANQRKLAEFEAGNRAAAEIIASNCMKYPPDSLLGHWAALTLKTRKATLPLRFGESPSTHAGTGVDLRSRGLYLADSITVENGVCTEGREAAIVRVSGPPLVAAGCRQACGRIVDYGRQYQLRYRLQEAGEN